MPGFKHVRRQGLQARRSSLRRWFRSRALATRLPCPPEYSGPRSPLAVPVEPRYRRVSSEAPMPDGPSPPIRYPAVPAVRPHAPAMVSERGPACGGRRCSAGSSGHRPRARRTRSCSTACATACALAFRGAHLQGVTSLARETEVASYLLLRERRIPRPWDRTRTAVNSCRSC